MIGVLIMMLSISPLMTLIALVILPISGGLIGFVVKHSQKYFVEQQSCLGEINGQVEETYSGHMVIRAFNREEAVEETFSRTNDRLYESAWKSQFISGLMQPIMTFVGNLGYVAVAVLKCSGGKRHDRGRRYPGVYPVCEKFHTADHTDCAGFKHAAVRSGCRRACF